ncbi:MAG: DNA polymerase III subunit chi [Gammaproteobacteria bacterium]|nr:DNA polymerase III subunit chi [Gammaproteobacteria bacterium]
MSDKLSQADFYQLMDPADTARLKLVCRLAAKAFEAKQSLYIHCSDSTEAQTVDDLLWTFHDVGFIPHAQAGAARAKDAIILIGSGNLPTQPAAILLNLEAKIPDGAEHYQRIIEVVAANDAAKKIASEHEKIYADWHKKINKHEIK